MYNVPTTKSIKLILQNLLILWWWKERSYITSWGSFGLVRAQLELYEELCRFGLWDFAINLSGADLPLRSIEDLSLTLAPYRNLNGGFYFKADFPLSPVLLRNSFPVMKCESDFSFQNFFFKKKSDVHLLVLKETSRFCPFMVLVTKMHHFKWNQKKIGDSTERHFILVMDLLIMWHVETEFQNLKILS